MSVDGVLPLTLARPGELLQLVALRVAHPLAHRLTELGLTPGVELRVMQGSSGPLVLAVRDSRLAIARATAHNILVRHLV